MQNKNNDSARRGELTEQYRPIGPAAVLAAVICAAKKIDKAEKAAAKKAA